MEFATDKDWCQAAFNLAYRGLRSQGFRQSKRGVHNMYRGSDDTPKQRVCCAVGWLIPDSSYSPSLEGFKVTNPKVREAIMPALQPISSPGYVRQDFLIDLQYAHDSADSAGVRRSLELLAKKWELRIPD